MEGIIITVTFRKLISLIGSRNISLLVLVNVQKYTELTNKVILLVDYRTSQFEV